MFQHVTSTVVALLAILSLGQAQCPYRECTCVNTVIDCSNKNLTAVPARLNTGATYTSLLLNNNRITAINSSSALPIKLDTLDLSGNPIVTLTSDALFGISQTLKVIKFKNSNFPTLPTALEILDNLETLDIENDALTFPDATVSKLAKSVISLRLANVGLAGWPAWLGQFAFLRKLYLDGSTRLGNPPAGTFANWGQQLTDLSVSNIGATTLSPISILEKLQWLDISNNRLSDSVGLSYDLIPMGNTLRFLNASNNQLGTEPRFVELRLLTEVHLSSNRITTITNGAFAPSVTTINLDNNQISAIPSFLVELPNLLNFSIKSNQITSINSNNFPVNSRITSLSLGKNPITSIDEHAFDNVRNSLTYLDLEGTRITRLPLALKVLVKLQTLWIPNNTLLVCTCDEKSLEQWITSLPTLRIVGQCGSVDVKEFVGQLASLCP
ncbi:hypothetical protein BsWGS_26500 [Bradybaena similaris]